MEKANGPVLTVEKLTLDLSGRRILRDINLAVARGEFLGVIGPNGGGKTSLLRVLLGILTPSGGCMLWSDASCGKPRVGYVPQRGGVDRDYPLSGREIVKQGAPGSLPLFGSRRREVNSRADELLGRVGLSEQAETLFANLSGGQQRRLLLARALMNDPNVLLLDEPTAGVDAQGQQQFCDILCELSRQGITVILVSHDIPLITAHADRIACLCVGLHWHGAAHALDQKTVHEAYRCELERYQVFTARKPAHVHPDVKQTCHLHEDC
jgi:zinc transport system ATP-binding protein